MEFRKNSFGDEDSAQLAKISSMFQNVADEAISASDSAQFIISQLIAFNQTSGDVAGNAMHIADALNEVANSYSVGTGDLATGLKVVASTSSAMGNSLEQTIGLMTAITEQTKSASKSARGLNAILANLAQVLDEDSSNGKKIIEIFDSLGLSMKEQNGQMKSGYDLLAALGGKWNDLNSNSQKYIATTLAGTSQLNNFLALMNNFEHAVDATNTALNSQGSALEENNRYLEGVEAKVTNLKASFQELANNVISSDLVKGVLNVLNEALALLNTYAGQTVTQLGLLTGVFTGIGGLINSMGLSTLIAGMKSLLVLGGKAALVAAAVMLLAKGISFLKQKWDEAHPSAEDIKEDLEKQNEELETNKKRLEELKKIPWSDRTSAQQDEIDRLEEINEKLQDNIDLRQQEAATKEFEEFTATNAPKTERKGYKVSKGYDEFESDTIGSLTEQLAQTNVFGDMVQQQAQQINDALEKTGGIVDREIIGKFNALTAVLKSQGVEVEEYVSGYDDFDTSLNKTIMAYQALAAKVENNKQLTADERAEFTKLQDVLQIYYDGLYAAKNGNVELTTTEQESYDIIKDLIPAFEELKDKVYRYNGEIDKTDEYVAKLTAGYSLNAEQVKILSDKYPGLSAALEEVNGYYSLNTSKLIENAKEGNQWAIDYINQQKAATEAAIKYGGLRVDALVKEAKALGQSEGYDSEAYKSKFNAAVGALNEVHELQKSLAMMNVGLKISSAKDLGLEDVVPEDENGNGTKTTQKVNSLLDERKEKYKEQVDILQHQLFLLEKQGASEEERIAINKKIQDYLHEQAEWYRQQGLDDNSEYIRELQEQWWSYQSNIEKLYDDIEEKATKAAQATLEAWRTALNESIEGIQGDIDAIQAASNYMVSQIEDEIEALEEEKQAISDRYQTQIDELNAANDAIEEQIELENALKKLNEAKAKKVMVYKDGRFQYVSDLDEVSSAQDNLANVERKQALKDAIADLETQRDKELAVLEQRIKGYEKYKDEWSNLAKDYEDTQNRLLAEQALGIELEGDNWKVRLAQAQEFVEQYTALMQQLQMQQQALQGLASGSADSTALEDYSKVWWEAKARGDQAGMDAAHAGAETIRAKYGFSGGASGSEYIPIGSGGSSDKKTSGKSSSSTIAGKVSSVISNVLKKLTGHADGTLSASGGLSLVGENGPELRVLGQGDGIIPANITRNLWDWGKINPNNRLSSGQSYVFNIDNLSLPNARDAESMFNGLKQMAMQRAYKRA